MAVVILIIRIMLEIQIFLQNILLIWWVITGKWKSDINGKPRWKPIRDWLYQNFVKIL